MMLLSLMSYDALSLVSDDACGFAILARLSLYFIVASACDFFGCVFVSIITYVAGFTPACL